jgi:hypothetical protein
VDCAQALRVVTCPDARGASEAGDRGLIEDLLGRRVTQADLDHSVTTFSQVVPLARAVLACPCSRIPERVVYTSATLSGLNRVGRTRFAGVCAPVKYSGVRAEAAVGKDCGLGGTGTASA